MSDNRYQRQETLEIIGIKGQKRLARAHICIVGCGGLGNISSPYLVGAGVGEITLIDGDRISLSNLHRQVFYNEEDIGKCKSQVLAERLKKLNSTIQIHWKDAYINDENIRDLIPKDTIVIEGSDDIMTKYLVNDYCFMENIPMIYGAIYKHEGYISLFINRDAQSIQLRDAFPLPKKPIATCSEVGVIGTLPGLVGIMQANEAIKLILGVNSNLIGNMKIFNVLENSEYFLSLQKKTALEERNPNLQALTVKTSKMEISYSEVSQNRNAYKLISILEDAIYEDIDDEVEQIPIDEIDMEDFEIDTEHIVVFYCKSGRRSKGLVTLIKHHHPEARVLSLKGGIKNYQDY